jgi:pimeloyl-ACP methyl ester carboxylesterase
MNTVLKSIPVFLLAGLVCFSCKKPAPMTTTSSLVVSGNMSISYQSCGNGDTTLLFIHGWCINKEYWSPQFDYFCNRYKVVAPDLPGFGQSGKNRTDWSFETYAQDIKSLIEQLKLKNVILIGHSMSGDIILKTDVAYPDHIIGLIGIDNLHNPGKPMDSIQLAGTDSFFQAMLANYQSTVEKEMPPYLFQPSTPDSIKKRVMNDILQTDPVISVKVSHAQVTISQQEQDLMRQLHHPLCLVNSDAFPTALDSLNKFCAHGAKLYLIPGSGHYPMIEQPSAFNAALQRAIWLH